MSDRMELPRQEDYDDMELYEHDMNMWVYDHLYSEDDDEWNRMCKWEREQEMLYGDDDFGDFE